MLLFECESRGAADDGCSQPKTYEREAFSAALNSILLLLFSRLGRKSRRQIWAEQAEMVLAEIAIATSSIQ